METIKVAITSNAQAGKSKRFTIHQGVIKAGEALSDGRVKI
jgi:hypothetical protein